MKRRIGDTWEDSQNKYICALRGVVQFEKSDREDMREYAEEMEELTSFLRSENAVR